MDEEKEALVIDNGTWMIKAGNAGGKTARAYIRTLIGTTSVDGNANINLFGDKVYYNRECTLTYPMDRGTVCDWDLMESVWEYIFMNEIQDGIEERCVLITEVPGNCPNNRLKMVEILMEKFRVSAVYVTDPAGLALISSGRDTGVVLDVGGGVTHVTALFKGKNISAYDQQDDKRKQNCCWRSNIGGNDITIYLSKLVNLKLDLGRSGSLFDLEAFKHSLYGFETTENPESGYSFDDITSITVNDVMKNCSDILFHPEKIDSTEIGIGELLCNAISLFEDDIKKELLGNIILSGGTTLMPGVVEKVESQVVETFKDYKNVIHIVAPPERRKSSWLGGSVIASLDKFTQLCKTKEDYLEKGVKEFLAFEGFEKLLN